MSVHLLERKPTVPRDLELYDGEKLPKKTKEKGQKLVYIQN